MNLNPDFVDVQEHIARLGFLSQALRTAPTADLYAALVGDDDADGPGLIGDDDAGSPGSLHEAVCDFNRLLEGPEKPVCPPWESAWLSDDDLLFQRETLEVRSAYRSQGLEIAGLGREPEDHIAFELAFCAFLLDRMIAAQQAQNEAAAAQSQKALVAFYDEHLGIWGAAWAHDLGEKARTGYWRELASLLEEEIASLGAMIDK